MNLLKRALDFRSIQVVQIAAYVGGFIVVGIPLALAGLQVWALVAAWLAQALITLIMYFAYARHPIKPLMWYLGAGNMMRYGVTVLVTNLVNWIIGNIDRVVIARVFESKDVGLYATVYNVLFNPTSSLLGVVQPVFFSASTRITDDRKRIAGGYVALIGCLSVFLLPVFAGLSVVAETFVLALYGEAWHGAAAIMSPLALAMPLFLAWGFTTPLIWAGGQPGREWKIQLPLALLWVLGTWAAARISPAAVGWSIVVLSLLRFFLMLRVAMFLLEIKASRVWLAVRNGSLS